MTKSADRFYRLPRTHTTCWSIEKAYRRESARLVSENEFFTELEDRAMKKVTLVGDGVPSRAIAVLEFPRAGERIVTAEEGVLTTYLVETIEHTSYLGTSTAGARVFVRSIR